MDFRRTLKKRRPKKHVPVRVDVVTPTGDRPKSRGIRIRRRGTTLNLAFWFAIFLTVAVVTQGHAEDYYFYEGRNGELVISNKEPPPGSKIIKRVRGVPDREGPQAQGPVNPQPKVQPEASPKPSKAQIDQRQVQPELTFRTSADRIPACNPRCPIVGHRHIGYFNGTLWPLAIDLKRGLTLFIT